MGVKLKAGGDPTGAIILPVEQCSKTEVIFTSFIIRAVDPDLHGFIFSPGSGFKRASAEGCFLQCCGSGSAWIRNFNSGSGSRKK